MLVLLHAASTLCQRNSPPPPPITAPHTPQGGTSIEDLAEKFPEKIVKIAVDIRAGITDAQAMEVRVC